MARYSASSSSWVSSPPPPPHAAYSNTAKLPIETVKRLIAAVARRPLLWLRNNNTKRSDLTPIWFEVSQDVNLPADICRIKWGHLRDNFRKIFIRNNLSDESPSSWRFYNDMRFMEQAVSENIKRQTKKHGPATTIRNNQYSENNNSSKYIGIGGGGDGGDGRHHYHHDATVPICELSNSYDSDVHRPSFSDITSFFVDCPQPLAKRIKFEPNSIAADDDSVSDSDFDEDAASDNDDEERMERKHNHEQRSIVPDSGIFTIEVMDDDEDIKVPLDERTEIKTMDGTGGAGGGGVSIKSEPIDLPFKYISVDASTNTESNSIESQDDDIDADRMFLMSLMPFLQKVDERRKLRVRQKLQNVLIEELEFG